MIRFAPRFILALLLASLASGVHPALAATLDEPSHAVCGAVANGELQKPCPSLYARYEAVSTLDCPNGDQPVNGQCYTCPAGFSRSFAEPTSDRACIDGDPSVKHEFLAATLVGPLCPPSSFYDPVRGGECWSCPDGFKRSATAVTAKGACVRGPIGKVERSPATLVRIAACESGSFLDLASGAKCWSCPAQTVRTAFPVGGDRACARLGGRKYAPATPAGSRMCSAPGQFWDGTGVNEEDLAEMRQRALDDKDDEEASRLRGLKTAKTGTCWSCPANYRRSKSGVKKADACTPTRLQWYTKPYREPGLFNLKGADAVLLEILRTNPKLAQDSLDKVAAGIAAASKTPVEQVKAQQKALLTSSPDKSPVASALLLVRLVAAATNPDGASPNEKILVESFRAYVSARRQYFAEDALKAYGAWKETDDLVRSRRAPNMEMLFDYGSVPPDFGTLAVVGALTGFVRDTAIGVAVGSVPLLGDVLSIALSGSGTGFAEFKSIDSVIRMGTRTAAEIAVGLVAEGLVERLATAAAEKALRDVAVKIAFRAGLALALDATEAAVAAASSMGPQIIVGMFVVIAQMSIDQVVEIQQAKRKLDSALAVAKQLPDLPRMTRTSDGMYELLSLWTAAASGGSTPPGGASYLTDLGKAAATLKP